MSLDRWDVEEAIRNVAREAAFNAELNAESEQLSETEHEFHCGPGYFVSLGAAAFLAVWHITVAYEQGFEADKLVAEALGAFGAVVLFCWLIGHAFRAGAIIYVLGYVAVGAVLYYFGQFKSWGEIVMWICAVVGYLYALGSIASTFMEGQNGLAVVGAIFAASCILITLYFTWAVLYNLPGKGLLQINERMEEKRVASIERRAEVDAIEQDEETSKNTMRSLRVLNDPDKVLYLNKWQRAFLFENSHLRVNGVNVNGFGMTIKGYLALANETRTASATISVPTDAVRFACLLSADGTSGMADASEKYGTYQVTFRQQPSGRETVLDWMEVEQIEPVDVALDSGTQSLEIELQETKGSYGFCEVVFGNFRYLPQ